MSKSDAWFYSLTTSNVSAVAEFNFHACPHAVNILLQATTNADPSKAIKLYMLPTDGNMICHSLRFST